MSRTDNRCTLPHDPIDADRDIPCWFCLTYGHVTEPRVSLDLRAVERSRRKAATYAYREARKLDAVKLEQASEIIAANERRMKLIQEILQLRAENAALKRR